MYAIRSYYGRLERQEVPNLIAAFHESSRKNAAEQAFKCLGQSITYGVV